MGKTSIEWATHVWNPVTGCTKVSQGCKNCYAERLAKRFWGERKFSDVQCHTQLLNAPLHWGKPARVFVNSMSDLFHPDVPLEFILRCWMIMAQARQHTFMILTKRPERMRMFITEWLPGAWGLATMSLRLLDRALPNIWLGVSVEDQESADKHLPYLFNTPAAMRFISVEPMLESITLQGWDGQLVRNYLGHDSVKGKEQRGPVDWVICGCESGSGRRPMETDWARLLRDQCQLAKVPFFLKQMEEGGKVVKMPELDGRVWAEYPTSEGK
jgi:protein gp37